MLIRGDGSYLYTFTSVVDDIDFGITQVIRGEDHVVNTAVQIEIFEALGGTVPQFAHHSLLIGADGKGLSKRLGSLSIRSLREQGLEAMAVVSHTALLGTSNSIHPCQDYRELIDSFDLGKLSRAPARFDEAELRHLNAKLLHMLPYEAVKDRLGYGDEAFWLAVRGNLGVLARCQGLVAGDCRRYRAIGRRGRPRLFDGSRGLIAGRTVGRPHMVCLDGQAQRIERAQRKIPLHAIAPRPHSARSRTGARSALAVDRARKERETPHAGRLTRQTSRGKRGSNLHRGVRS